MSENTLPTTVVAGFDNSLAFEFMQRQAQMLSSSELVPEAFSIVKCKDTNERNRKIANTMIALEMANRIGASPLAVLQNIYMVHGKPSWSSTFIIASINGCGRFTALKFDVTGEGDERTCVAYTTEKATGDRLDSPPVSIGMAKKEGWYGKSGSKWQTMPELMLRYRAATLFGRLYAPEILMGMRAVEELEDVEVANVKTNIMERFDTAPILPETVEAPESAPVEEVVEAKVLEPETASTTDLLQEVYALLAIVAEIKETTPDDFLDELTKGKVGCQVDLEDKPEPYLLKMKIALEGMLPVEEAA